MHWVFDSDLPGFDPLKWQIGALSRILVDGNPITYCIEADEENGFVRRYTSLDFDKTETIKGVVKVEPRDDLPPSVRQEYKKLRSELCHSN